MAKILADERPLKCSKCNSNFLRYTGLGEFTCETCGNTMLNNYGKVRAYLDTHENAPVNEVAEATGVSEENISILVSEQKITAVVDSRFRLLCKECGSQILLGDYCDACKKKREQIRDSKIRAMLGEKQPANHKKFLGYSSPSMKNSGRMRYNSSNKI